MRKIYSKPEILFENFMANVNIAACGVDTDLPTTNSCGISFGEDVLFLSSSTGCNFPVTEGDNGYNGICYHNPFVDTRLFGS